MKRREFLKTVGVAAAGATALPRGLGATGVARSTLPHGLAAGDVRHRSAMMWTRSTEVGPLLFEYSRDSSFRRSVRRRRAFVRNPLAPVKRLATGLRPGSTYYYRVRDAAGEEALGRFRTPHPVGTHAGLRFGVSGDSRGELAPYPSLADVPGRDLDFFVELGDTIYADFESPILPGVDQARSLREFRLKHSEILNEHDGLNAVADLRGSTALFAMIDDHEVRNDFAGGAHPGTDDRFDPHGQFINETRLYRAGLKAFTDFMPIRPERYRDTGDPRTRFRRKLYRARHFGSDAALFLVDARSFRDAGLRPADPFDPADVTRFLVESFDPRRTMLGAAQLEELQRDLLETHEAGITWKFVMVPEPIQNFGAVAASDRFEGYAAERSRLLAFITEYGIDNVVFVAADIHGTSINDLSYQTAVGQPQIDTGAFEVTTGPIAFDAPFGPTLVQLALDLGLISAGDKAFYDGLPRPAKEEFVRGLIDGQVTGLGYPTLGLEGSSIQSTLLEGSYLATHTYGWTEFEIDPDSQKLLITTRGVLPDQPAVSPMVVSQFEVAPR